MTELESVSTLPRLSVGRAVGDTFAVVRRAWFPLAALSILVALASLPFAFLYAQELHPLMTWLKAGGRGTPPVLNTNALYGSLGGFYFLQIAVTVYVFGVVVSGVTRFLTAGRFDIGASLKDGIVRVLPMLLAGIAFYIVLVLGLALFVVPGLIFGAAFGLAPLLCVTERRGPMESFSRSADLTRGNRWRCLAVTIILTLVPGIIVAVVSALLLRPLGAQNNFIVAAALNVVVLPIYYAFPAVLAHNLRRLQEGGGPSGVADVF